MAVLTMRSACNHTHTHLEEVCNDMRTFTFAFTYPYPQHMYTSPVCAPDAATQQKNGHINAKRSSIRSRATLGASSKRGVELINLATEVAR